MAKNEKKVIEFDPQKKKRLKSLNYKTEKKEMLRKEQQKKKVYRSHFIKLAGIFLLICLGFYILIHGISF